MPLLRMVAVIVIGLLASNARTGLGGAEVRDASTPDVRSLPGGLPSLLAPARRPDDAPLPGEIALESAFEEAEEEEVVEPRPLGLGLPPVEGPDALASGPARLSADGRPIVLEALPRSAILRC